MLQMETRVAEVQPLYFLPAFLHVACLDGSQKWATPSPAGVNM